MEHTAKTMKASMEDPDHQSTQSGALVGSNDDLLTQILLRLPATSILRFKSVSKHWLWLLTDKHFTQRYDKLLKSPGLFARHKYVPFDVENPNPNPPPFLSFSVDAAKPITTGPFRSLDTYFDRPGVKILQSCNGLLLCSTDRGPNGCRGALRYYVFNPTTKQLALIPPLPRRMKESKSICFMALAYHPTDCLHYKAVRVTSLDRNGTLFQVQIYSSDTRKWKISIQSFSAPWKCFREVAYWNGAVHWAPYHDKFFYFKIDVEQMQPLPFPVEWMPSQVLANYLGESRGHLHLIAYMTRQETNLCLNVYEMFSDHSGWFVKYHVQLDALPGAFPDMISRFDDKYCFKVIDVVRGEEEEDTFLVLNTPKSFITYNVHDKSFKQIFSYPMSFREGCLDFHRYTETLSSF